MILSITFDKMSFGKMSFDKMLFENSNNGLYKFKNFTRTLPHFINLLSAIAVLICSEKSYSRERLSTVDLLVLTSLNQLLFKSKIFFKFLTKQAVVMKRSTVLTLSPQFVFPDMLNGVVLGVLGEVSFSSSHNL